MILKQHMQPNPFKKAENREIPLEQTWGDLFGEADKQLLQRMVGSSLQEDTESEISLGGNLSDPNFEMREDTPQELFLEAEQRAHGLQLREQLNVYQALVLNAAKVGFDEDKYIDKFSTVAWEHHREGNEHPVGLTMLVTTKARLGKWDDLAPELAALDKTRNQGGNRTDLAKIAVDQDNVEQAKRMCNNVSVGSKEIGLVLAHARKQNKPVEQWIEALGVNAELAKVQQKDSLSAESLYYYADLVKAKSFSKTLSEEEKQQLEAAIEDIKKAHDWTAPVSRSNHERLAGTLVTSQALLGSFQQALLTADQLKSFVDNPSYNAYRPLMSVAATEGKVKWVISALDKMDDNTKSFQASYAARELARTGDATGALQVLSILGDQDMETKTEATMKLIRVLNEQSYDYQPLLRQLSGDRTQSKDENLEHLVNLYTLYTDLDLPMAIDAQALYGALPADADADSIIENNAEFSTEILEQIFELANNRSIMSRPTANAMHQIRALYVRDGKWDKVNQLISRLDNPQWQETATSLLLQGMIQYAANAARNPS